MGFFLWLFDVSNRHQGEMRRYEKGGLGTRITSLIILIALVTITLLIEYWCINLFKSSFVLGFVVLLLLIAAVPTTIEFCGVYSFIGFRMATRGYLIKLADNLDKEIAKKRDADKQIVAEVTVENGTTSVELHNENIETDKEIKKLYKYRGFDIFVGIFSLALAFGLIAGVIILPFYV